jgi:hypothetical protein
LSSTLCLSASWSRAETNARVRRVGDTGTGVVGPSLKVEHCWPTAAASQTGLLAGWLCMFFQRPGEQRLCVQSYYLCGERARRSVRRTGIGYSRTVVDPPRATRYCEAGDRQHPSPRAVSIPTYYQHAQSLSQTACYSECLRNIYAGSGSLAGALG